MRLALFPPLVPVATAIAAAGTVLLGALPGCGESPRSKPMALGATPPAEDRGWPRVLFLDFGRRDQRAPGSLAVSRTFLYHEAGWVGGMTRNGSSESIFDPYLRDYVEGEESVFALGVRPAPVYRLLLSLGDPDQPRGPFAVSVNEKPLEAGVTTGAGEVTELRAEVAAPDGEIQIRFAGEDCGSFAVVGLALYAPPGASPADTGEAVIRKIYSGEMPRPRSFHFDLHGAAAGTEARRILQESADYLLAQEPSEGGFSYSGNWYENAFPVRALLAAHRLLGTEAYRDAAFRVLDRFVAEQGENGEWSSQYFGKPGCPLADATASAGHSANLADIGVMAQALTLAASRTEGERRSRYLSAAARYADRVVLPNQLGSGGFPNLLYKGVEYRGVYSVATAVQAGNLAVLYDQTGDRRYLEASERAASLLAEECREGETLFHPHDKAGVDTLGADRMGDLFYVAEGLLIAAHYAEPPYRQTIEKGLRRLLGGERGVFARVTEDAWWEPVELWERSKRAGALYLWELYTLLPGSPPFTSGPGPQLLGCLADADCAGWHGVRTPPHAPEGKFAMVTTGFAGLGLAGFLDPAGLFPVPAAGAPR